MRDGVVLEPGTWRRARTSSGPATMRRSGRRVGRFFEDYRDMRLSSFELADREIEDGGRGLRRGARLPRPRLSRGRPTARVGSATHGDESSGRPQRPQSLRYIADALGFGWSGVS